MLVIVLLQIGIAAEMANPLIPWTIWPVIVT
jgi:hypothetical protein